MTTCLNARWKVRDNPQYDKHGRPRYWVYFKGKERFARNYIASDDDFSRIATADQVMQEPRSIRACATSHEQS